MQITPEAVASERDRITARTSEYVGLINDARDRLGAHFDQDVGHVTDDAFREAVEEVFADGDRAANVAALASMLRELDVRGDYPGFIVDEILGRALASTIAGGQPRAMLAEASFHFIDVTHDLADAPAGVDDMEAAIAAGVQTRLSGWPWQTVPGPFDDLP